MSAEQARRMDLRILTIETSCDETAAAIVTDQLEVLSSVVASQDQLHERFHGVVPEIAARAHVERILPVIDEALCRAKIKLSDLDGIAVANTPGLAGSLLVGVTAAKALCVATGKPLLAVNHLHAHVYACQIALQQNIFPCIGFIVSGGHTHLYHCASATEFRYLGGTIDDAAGEAFDKIAAMLGLPYPGGPSVSQAATTGNAEKYAFPRPFLRDRNRLAFSFSGLKTAVRYAIAGTGKVDFQSLQLTEQQIADVAASFQAAVVDCLVGKAMLAIDQTRLARLCVGGGVAANTVFRERLTETCQQNGIELHIAPPQLCTDNAIMGGLAIEHLKAGRQETLDLDVLPGLVRGS